MFFRSVWIWPQSEMKQHWIRNKSTSGKIAFHYDKRFVPLIDTHYIVKHILIIFVMHYQFFKKLQALRCISNIKRVSSVWLLRNWCIRVRKFYPHWLYCLTKMNIWTNKNRKKTSNWGKRSFLPFSSQRTPFLNNYSWMKASLWKSRNPEKLQHNIGIKPIWHRKHWRG